MAKRLTLADLAEDVNVLDAALAQAEEFAHAEIDKLAADVAALAKADGALAHRIDAVRADVRSIREVVAIDHDTLAFRIGAVEQRAVAGRGFFGRFRWLLTGK